MGSKPKAPGETAEQKEMAEIAAESYEDWRQRWLPIQREFFAEMMDVEPRREEALGSANVDYQASFGRAQEALEGGLMRSGAGPGSGRFAMGLGGFANDRAQAMGQGAADVNAMIDDQYVQGLQTLVDIGQGQRTSALRGMSQAADAAQQQSLMDARTALNARSARQNTFGTAAGMAAAYGLRGAPEFGSDAWGSKMGLDNPISSGGPTIEKFNF